MSHFDRSRRPFNNPIRAFTIPRSVRLGVFFFLASSLLIFPACKKKAANQGEGGKQGSGTTATSSSSSGGQRGGGQRGGGQRGGGRRPGGGGPPGAPGQRGETGGRSTEFLTPVVAHRLDRRELEVTVAATASVAPIRSETIESLESGIVVFTRAWEEGDMVTSGTLVATLDNEDLRKELQTFEKDLEIQRENLRMANTRLKQAEREYEIVQDLYSRGIAPLKEVESTKLTRDTQRNQLRQSEINLAKAELNLKSFLRRIADLNIYAPFTGLLVSRSTIEGKSGLNKTFGSEPLRILEGRFVGKNTIICGIIDVSRALLLCDITSKDIAKIRVGQHAYGVVYGKENIEVKGKVVFVSSNVNPETRAFEVQVEVDNADGRLRPGMFGRVEIVVQSVPDTIAVEKAIVQRRGDKSIVFVV